MAGTRLMGEGFSILLSKQLYIKSPSVAFYVLLFFNLKTQFIFKNTHILVEDGFV